jgi:hypothetical protein
MSKMVFVILMAIFLASVESRAADKFASQSPAATI